MGKPIAFFFGAPEKQGTGRAGQEWEGGGNARASQGTVRRSKMARVIRVKNAQYSAKKAGGVPDHPDRTERVKRGRLWNRTPALKIHPSFWLVIKTVEKNRPVRPGGFVRGALARNRAWTFQLDSERSTADRYLKEGVRTDLSFM